jgi:flagellar biosynthesis protein FlhF
LEDFDKVQAAVLEWIGEGIKICVGGKGNTDSERIDGNGGRIGIGGRARIIAIVGPTGVGKTTTVAKLAAIFGLENKSAPALRVRMVTIDNYKIAAKKQIETYAEIMQIPVSFAENRSDLEKILDLYGDVDVVLIDTIGKSPNDFVKLAEMRSVLDACGRESEVHLAISATTKNSDIEEIFRQFESFKYVSVILTKLDETYRIGNIISILSEHDKSLSYITDGQMVPQDIEPARVSRLLMSLEGFRVDKEHIEKKFGPKVVDTKVGW